VKIAPTLMLNKGPQREMVNIDGVDLWIPNSIVGRCQNTNESGFMDTIQDSRIPNSNRLVVAKTQH
jgi:hypothetical protein